MNEEDGQADVKQDHHADEDGVRDLGAVERGCVSPQGLCPDHNRLDGGAGTSGRTPLRAPPYFAHCSVQHLDSRPSGLEKCLEIINQTTEGPERGKDRSQGTQRAVLGLEPRNGPSQC